jgi:hypothetical protein
VQHAPQVLQHQQLVRVVLVLRQQQQLQLALAAGASGSAQLQKMQTTRWQVRELFAVDALVLLRMIMARYVCCSACINAIMQVCLYVTRVF